LWDRCIFVIDKRKQISQNMKTYKLNNNCWEWHPLIENCEIQMQEKGKSEEEIAQVIDLLASPKPHSKTKSLYQMSDEIAQWMHKELTYRIGWYEDRISYEDGDKYEDRKVMAQLKTLLRQLESQL